VYERKLGDFSVSRMTLGTAQLGMEYGIPNRSKKMDDITSYSLLEKAIAGGINCFDTAYSYGSSEQLLGNFFAQRKKPLIVSKLNLSLDPKLTAKELEYEMRSKIEESLGRLQLSRVSLLLLHQPEILLYHGHIVTTLCRKLENEGFVDKWGVSLDSHTEQQFHEIWRWVQYDVYEAVQIPINIFDHRLIHFGAMRLLEETQKFVFARSIFLKGLFFLKEEEIPANLQEAISPLRLLHELAAEESISVEQLALAYVRDMNTIHSLVIGAETPEQIEVNIGLMQGPSIGEETRARVNRELAEMPEKIVTPRHW
jgi:aryl-alcohol dehydrogenase-like predicted oxidoreductase